jgi:hypothetical protein
MKKIVLATLAALAALSPTGCLEIYAQTPGERMAAEYFRLQTERITDLDGTDPRFCVARGVVLLQLRHFDEAARCLKIGVDLKPHYGEADARVFLADALWGAGRKAEAAAEWMRVSKTEPSYPGYEQPINEAKRRLAERPPT